MPNPGVTTLGAIRALCAQQADMPTSSTTTYITTAEWNSYINGSYYELYDLLIQKYGENYFSALDANGKGYQFTTDGSNEVYALPDGSSTYKMPDGTTAPAFYKGLGVDLWLSSTSTQPQQWFTLHRFNYSERNRWTIATLVAPYGYIGLRYRFEGNKLWLRPFPAAGQLIQVRYAPRLTALVNDNDTVDGVSGWEEYIIVDAVIKAKLKEESDPSGFFARKADLRQRIEAAADNRDPGEPQTVAEVEGGAGASGWPGGGFGGVY